MEETVMIPRKEYERLKADSEFLALLYAAGVEETTVYEYACEVADGY